MNIEAVRRDDFQCLQLRHSLGCGIGSDVGAFSFARSTAFASWRSVYQERGLVHVVGQRSVVRHQRPHAEVHDFHFPLSGNFACNPSEERQRASVSEIFAVNFIRAEHTASWRRSPSSQRRRSPTRWESHRTQRWWSWCRLSGSVSFHHLHFQKPEEVSKYWTFFGREGAAGGLPVRCPFPGAFCGAWCSLLICISCSFFDTRGKDVSDTAAVSHTGHIVYKFLNSVGRDCTECLKRSSPSEHHLERKVQSVPKQRELLGVVEGFKRRGAQ